MRGITQCAAILALLTGCRAKPLPPPTVADLHFPVAVNYQRGSVVLFRDATSLHTMSIGQLNAVTEPPPLIDSKFAIYTLEKLGSTHNFLWLMINPTGSTPVKFELKRAPKSGIEAARAVFRSRLDEQHWRDNMEEKRRELDKELTLTGMVELVNESPAD